VLVVCVALPVITWRNVVQTDCHLEREQLKHELAVFLKAFDHARKAVIFQPHSQAIPSVQLEDSVVDARSTPPNQDDCPEDVKAAPPDAPTTTIDSHVAADVHNEELGMLYSFVFMIWRLNSQILNATRDSESSLKQNETATRSTSSPIPNMTLKQRVAAFWDKKTARFDESSAKVALRLAITILVASLFALIPALRRQFDYSFWAAVRLLLPRLSP
jgi:hypothetical protein